MTSTDGMSQDPIAQLKSLVDGAEDWHAAARNIRKGLEEPLSPEASALKDAFDYHFPVADGPEAPFGAQMEFGDRRHPQSLTAVDEERLQVWADLFAEIDHPLVRARLGDLLWQRKYGNAIWFARGALEAYVALVKQQPSVEDATLVMHRQDCLMRAVDLAREINSSSIADVIQLAMDHATDELDRDEPSPGVAIPTLQKLASLSPSQRPGLGELLKQAKERFGSSPFYMEDLLRLEETIATDAEKKQLRETMVRQWMQAAEADDGLGALMYLQRAHELAVSLGTSDLLGDIRNRLGAAGEAARASYSEISAEVEIPTEQINQFIDQFFQDPGWLIRIGHYVPLSGDPEEAEKSAREQLRHSVVSALATTVITNDEGRVVRILQTDEDRLAWEITKQNVMAAQMWSIFAHDVLRRAGASDRPTRNQLVEHFSTELIAVDVAEKISNAFAHFWEERYDEAVCVALPRLETVVREIAKAVGVPIYNEPTAQEPGMYRTLGTLLDGLKGKLPANIHLYLRTVLSDPHAINLRNRLCHGLLITPSRQDAALTLHVATVLATLRREVPSESDAT